MRFFFLLLLFAALVASSPASSQTPAPPPPRPTASPQTPSRPQPPSLPQTPDSPQTPSRPQPPSPQQTPASPQTPSRPQPPQPPQPPPQGFEPPKLLQFIQAPYPPEEEKARRSADVLLQIIVDEKGQVSQVTILRSASPAFDAAALSAVRRFAFLPARFQGKPVSVSITYRYSFTLQALPASRPSADTPSSKPAGDAASSQSSKPAQGGETSSRPSTLPTPQEVAASRSSASSQPTPPLQVTKAAIRQGGDGKAKDKNFPVVEGYVLERGTRKPIEGATVYLLGKKKAQEITDENGFFSVGRLPAGKYRFVIPVPNYDKLQSVIDVTPKEKFTITVYLNRTGIGSFESTTLERRDKIEVNRQTLQQEEIRLAPGTQGDPLKVVQNLPGVARTPLNTGFFIVRGSAPGDSRTYLDGHQIPQLYHFGGLTAVVNGDSARQLDFIPGGFSVAFGRATGGVIHLQTRPGADRFHGYLKVDFIDAGGFLEGPLWKGATFIASFRRSHLDAFLNLILPEDRAFDLTVAPRYYDFQFKIDWNVNPSHRLSFMYFGSGDKLSFLRDEPIGRSDIRGSFLFYTAFHRVNFGWTFEIPGKLEHEALLQVGFTQTRVDGGGQFGLDSWTPVISLRDELRLRLHPTLRFRAGLDARLRYSDTKVTSPANLPASGDPVGGGTADPLRTRVSFTSQEWLPEPALYAELDWQPTPGLRLIPGLRVDYFGTSPQVVLNPRLNVAWTTPWKALTLKGSVGLFSQPPGGTDTTPQLGNPDLKSIHAMHYTLGTEFQWTDFFTTEFTFYYKDIWDLVVRSNATVIRDGQEVAQRLKNGGLGRAYGLEVLIRHKPYQRFFGWISYTLGRSERQTNPPSGPWELFNFDQTHILTFLGAFKIGWGLTFSARFRLVSGNPYTPFQGGVYDADALNYFPIPGATNSARSPLFHQLDLRLDYEIKFTTWILQIYIDVQNVYYQLNEEGRINNYDYTRQAPLTGIPILPSFGIKGQF